MRRWIPAALLLFAISWAYPATAAPAPNSGWQVRHYTTGNSSELVTTIPITKATGGAYRVVYCLDLGDAPQGGEILQVDGHMQVTNDTGDVVSFGTHIYLADDCTKTGGTEIVEAQGGNATPSEHHAAANRSGSITVEEGNSRRYVVMLAWSACTSAQSWYVLKVDQDYGRLSVVRFTPA